jgi:hypothetical protein
LRAPMQATRRKVRAVTASPSPRGRRANASR